MIFILGSGGFVGTAFCEACVETGILHQGIDRENYDEFKGRCCETLIFAAGNSKKYLAGENPLLDFELSVCSVAKSLFDFKFRKYVHISSVAVYGNHSDPVRNHEGSPLDIGSQSVYGFHKRLAEELVMRHCDDWLVLRLGGMVGERMSKGPVFDILRGIPLRFHPMSRFQFLNTGDMARLVLKMLDAGCSREIFNVCGRGTITLRKILELAGRAEDNDLQVETWNVSTDKTHGRFGLPTTEETIRGFISRLNLRPAGKRK
ncbi:MAG: NAD(P)-dependent oxidoreductase [Candidatus Tritonobacter lacicola]|nr:NAD(P)-dependent oxidoreductase [Candidatus Tritonobacter lacicola]